MLRGARLGWSLVIGTALVLAGCSPTSTSSGASPTSTGAAATRSPAPTGSAAAGGPIKIGVINSFTGFAAQFGQWAMDDINMALSDLGADVRGRPIQLIPADEMCSAEGGVNAANRLIGQVIIVIGPECSAAGLAAEPVLARAKIPHMVDGYLCALTQQGDEWVFQTVPNDCVQMQVLAQYIKDQGISKVAVANDTTPFGAGEAQGFLAAWKSLGFQDPLNVTFDPSATDFSGQIQRIKQSDAQAIVVNAFEGPSALFVKQARQLGLTQKIFGGLTFGDDIFSNAAGSAAEGTVFVTNFNDGDPKAKPHADRFKQLYATDPGTLVGPYLAMAAVLDALKRAGPDATPEQLRDAIRATDIDTPVGHASWNAKGELTKPEVYVGQYVNGKRAAIKRVTP